MKFLLMKLKFPTKVTIASGGTPQTLSATPLLVTSFSVLWRATNTGTVYVGESDVTANKCFPLSVTTPSFSVAADDSPGSFPQKVYDLNQIYIDGTTNDVVYIIYSVVSEGRNS